VTREPPRNYITNTIIIIIIIIHVAYSQLPAVKALTWLWRHCMSLAQGTRTLWAKHREQEHYEQSTGNKNIMSKAQGTRTLWPKHREQEHYEQSTGNKNIMSKAQGTRTLWAKSYFIVGLKICHHHHRLYSPGWALASSSQCRQRFLPYAAASQFLQPSFLASSCTPSIHLDFRQPRPHWPPGFVHNIFVRGGADKSLVRSTSRCCRTDSMSLKRGVCSCAELQVFPCYRGWKEACQATRAISTTWRRELSSSFFFLQGTEGNSRHSDRNIRVTCTMVCHRQKQGGPV